MEIGLGPLSRGGERNFLTKMFTIPPILFLTDIPKARAVSVVTLCFKKVDSRDTLKTPEVSRDLLQ